MAKKRPSKKKSAPGERASAGKKSGPLEDLGRRLDEIPMVESAEAAVEAARAELEKAQAYCQQVRQDAADVVKQVQESSAGDWIDSTLRQVRKHPGPGVIVSFLLGMFLGRLFRK
jgi:ElaB/YqjD/DUF883 family membrane-anchored ribosome-binding protein